MSAASPLMSAIARSVRAMGDQSALVARRVSVMGGHRDTPVVNELEELALMASNLLQLLARARDDDGLTEHEAAFVSEAQALSREKDLSFLDIAEKLRARGLVDERGRAYGREALARILRNGSRYIVDEGRGSIVDVEHLPIIYSRSGGICPLSRAACVEGAVVYRSIFRLPIDGEVEAALARGAIVSDDVDVDDDDDGDKGENVSGNGGTNQ